MTNLVVAIMVLIAHAIFAAATLYCIAQERRMLSVNLANERDVLSIWFVIPSESKRAKDARRVLGVTRLFAFLGVLSVGFLFLAKLLGEADESIRLSVTLPAAIGLAVVSIVSYSLRTRTIRNWTGWLIWPTFAVSILLFWCAFPGMMLTVERIFANATNILLILASVMMAGFGIFTAVKSKSLVRENSTGKIVLIMGAAIAAVGFGGIIILAGLSVAAILK